MIFSVVDIETTGGSPVFDRIVEIGIIRIEDGKIAGQFQSLVRPERQIPANVTLIHGITNEMVQEVPTFEDLADDIQACLQDSIFVAHSVAFDFGFLKESFRRLGKDLDLPKVCTVKLGKKLLPHLRSHSLAALCAYFNIQNKKAHRALEDAEATAYIFQQYRELDGFEAVLKSLMKRSGKSNKLPPNLNEEELQNLPAEPGVYLFHNKAGKVLYVGKAINVKDRVLQHFSGHTHTRSKSGFLEEIYHISYQLCGHEFLAFLVENALIKEHYPRYNSTNKEFKLPFGIFHFTDQRHLSRLVVGQAGKWTYPERVFKNNYEAVHFLLKLSLKHGLCLKLNLLTAEKSENCTYENDHGLRCVLCQATPDIDTYNSRMQEALEELQSHKASSVWIMQGRTADETGMVWISNGKIKGYGFVETQQLTSQKLSSVSLTSYYDTQDSQSILHHYLPQATPTGEYLEGIPILMLP